MPAGDVATRSLLAALERHDAGAGALANYDQVAAAAAELRRRRDAARDAHRRLADQQIQQQGRLYVPLLATRVTSFLWLRIEIHLSLSLSAGRLIRSSLPSVDWPRIRFRFPFHRPSRPLRVEFFG